MREGMPQNEALPQQFEEYLRKLGIEVVFDEDERLETGSRLAERLEEAYRDKENGGNRQIPSRVARRASFTSLQDTFNSQRILDQEMQEGLPARSRSQNSVPLRQETRTGKRASRFRSDGNRSMRSIQFTKPFPRSRLKGTTKLSKTSTTVSSKRQSFSSNDDDNSQASTYCDEFDGAQFNPEAQDESRHVTQANGIHSRVASGLLEIDKISERHRYRHLALFACKLFHLWRETCQKIRPTREQLRKLAYAKDAITLKRQVFDHWQDACRIRERDKETESFYQSLEDQAATARDLFLLTKAFTHWAQCTSEEALRSSAARRHILRTKYFNAYREVTAINETKVRRIGLRKFVNIWKHRKESLVRLNQSASVFYSTQLLKHSYRLWFWQFCNHRTPSWYGGRLRARFFQKWIQLARNATIRNTWCSNVASLKLLRGVFDLWLGRSSIIQEQDDIAQSIRGRNLLVLACESLRRELKLISPKLQVRQKIDARITRFAFLSWSYKARSILEAKRVDELRAMRNAWTAWNDQLRLQDLSRSIDDRLVMQALYQWLLVARRILFRRVSETKLKFLVFRHWRHHLGTLSSSFGNATCLARQSEDQTAKGRVLQTLTAALIGLGEMKAQAQAFRNRALSSKALKAWTSCSQHTSKLRKWAARGEFYILAKKRFRSWQESFLKHKKRKRSEAYAVVRRRRKLYLSSGCLDRLQHQVEAYQAQRVKAEDLDQQRFFKIRTMIFFEWLDRAKQILEQANQARLIYQQHLLSAHANAITERQQHLKDLNLQAENHLDDILAVKARNFLGKFSWRVWQIKRHEKDAESFLEEKVSQPHQRKMLRYWHEKALERRASYRVNQISRDESDAKLNPLQSSVLPQTPGYLRTPSRRTISRSRPKLPAPKTPATTQMTPFMGRLRSQYDGGEFAKRLRQPIRAIEDIPETDSRAEFGE